MDCRIEKCEDYTLVVPFGRIDLTTIVDFKTIIEDIPLTNVNLIFDLSQTVFITSTGLTVFLNAIDRSKVENGKVAFIGINQKIKLLFELSEIHSDFVALPDIETALNYFKQQSE